MSSFNKFPSLLSILFCLFLSPVFSQNTFQRSYGANDLRIDGGYVLATAGGYVLTAYVRDSTPNHRPVLMKLSQTGSIIWLKKYGNGNTGEDFSQVIEANDGGFLAVGTSNGTNNSWNPAMLIVKTDANGNLEWEKILPDYLTNRKNGASTVVAFNGGYIISGYSKKNYTTTVLLRIDNQGDIVWSKRYATGTIDNIYLRASFVSGDTIFASGKRDSIATFSMFNATTGAPLSNTLFDNPALSDKELNYMTPASNGDLLLSGLVHSEAGGGLLWVCRISRTGVLKWSKTYSGTLIGRIVPMAGDQFLLVTNVNANINNTDPVLIKINGDGEILWSYKYGIAGYDGFQSAVETPDGGVLAVGITNPIPNISHSHILIVKTDVNGLVAGCCRQPFNTVVTTLPIVQSPQVLNQFAFDNLLGTDMIQADDSLTQTDYCPMPVVVQNVGVSLCPGDSIVIDGTAYTSAGVVTSILQGSDCDTTVLYNIQIGINPTLKKTISFCPGDSVIIGNTAFTQPDTFTQAVPSVSGGCDTLVTYFLQYTVPSAPSSTSIHCPADIAVFVPTDNTSATVTYATPTVQGDCECPGSTVARTQGPASGSAFPLGANTVCFEAQDHCGNQASCCFQVQVMEEDDEPCDVKVNGCIRFELLRISRDAQQRKTYHIRVQNNCSQSLTYAAFQLPDGVVAYGLQNNATYIAPSGRSYTVRNPNNAPIHSIRFSTQGGGIQGGGSDIFEYTLPPQSAPTFINALVKLSGLPALETHLNTFYCPVELPPASSDRSADTAGSVQTISVFPNPAQDVLFVDLKAWSSLATLIRVFNPQGQVMLMKETNEVDQLKLQLNLPSGVYWLEAKTLDGGQQAVKRFVIR